MPDVGGSMSRQQSQYSQGKTPVDKDLFNLDDDTKGNDYEEEEEEEEEIDWSLIEPSKVNWFKFILDKNLKLTDDEGNVSALNTPHAVVNLLNIILTSKKNEEIQEELLDLVGYHNFELLGKLIEKRDIIKEQCKSINEKLQVQSQSTNYKGKNMDFISAPGSSVTVTIKQAG